MSRHPRFSRDDYLDSAMDDYPWHAKALLAVVICVVGILSKMLWFWRIEDGGKLWDSREPRVIVMNHVSFLETIIPSMSMWVRRHHVRPVYKSEFDENPLLRWLLPRMGGIPVDRGTADMRAVRRSVACLKRGESILVFPEGTRIHDGSKPTEIHSGYALMARMAGVPVQPMAVAGIKGIKATGGSLIRPFTPVRLKVGDCVAYGDMTAEGRRERTEELAQVGMSYVYAMRDELEGKKI